MSGRALSRCEGLSFLPYWLALLSQRALPTRLKHALGATTSAVPRAIALMLPLAFALALAALVACARRRLGFGSVSCAPPSPGCTAHETARPGPPPAAVVTSSSASNSALAAAASREDRASTRSLRGRACLPRRRLVGGMLGLAALGVYLESASIGMDAVSGPFRRVALAWRPPRLPLARKAVVVTGASSGIGAATVARLASGSGDEGRSSENDTHFSGWSLPVCETTPPPLSPLRSHRCAARPRGRGWCRCSST